MGANTDLAMKVLGPVRSGDIDGTITRLVTSFSDQPAAEASWEAVPS